MLDDFLQAIDIPKSRIIDYPRYLFLCGGCVSTNGQTRIPASLRHTLLQKIATDYPELQSTILLAGILHFVLRQLLEQAEPVGTAD
jgi:hypothetical protein